MLMPSIDSLLCDEQGNLNIDKGLGSKNLDGSWTQPLFFPPSTWSPILNLKKLKLEITKYIVDVFI